MKIIFNILCFLLFVQLFSSCNTKLMPQMQIDCIDLKDFGVVGDGKIDDTAKIQDAIRYAKRNNIREVDFGSAKYLISATLEFSQSDLLINLNKSTIVFQPSVGEGKNTVAIKVKGEIALTYSNLNSKKLASDNNESYFRIVSKELDQDARNYYFKNEFIQRDGVKKDSKGLKHTVLDYKQPFRIEKINFVENVKIKGGNILCNQKTNSTGIIFEYSNACSIEGVKVEGTAVAGMNFDKSIFSTAIKNVIWSPNDSGLGLDYGILFTKSQYGECHNNKIRTSRTGVDLTMSHYINITKNETFDCGISPHAGSHILVDNNIINNGSVYFRSYNSVISNNIIYTKSGMNGITITEVNGKSNIKVLNNEINCNPGQPNQITGISIKEVDFSDIIISKNIINNFPTGINVIRPDNGKGNKNLKIIENIIKGVSVGGIFSDRYDNQLIKRNEIIGTEKGVGIRVWASGGNYENIKILENKITKVNIGLWVESFYKNVYVQGNSVFNTHKPDLLNCFIKRK